MMIDSEVLKKKLNDKSIVDWIDDDNSPINYKQGYLSGIIKALSVVGEVEYFTKNGHDRPPIDFELDDEAAESLRVVMKTVNDKLKELELSSHSEKDIVNGCIGLMDSVHGHGAGNSQGTGHQGNESQVLFVTGIYETHQRC